MAEQKKEEAKESGKKGVNVALILQLVFALVNLGAIGAGAFVTYKYTLGYHPPVITEESLRAPASVPESAAAKPEHQAPAPPAASVAVSDLPEFDEYTQKLEKFTVNLYGEPQRVVRLEVNLQMLDQESFEEVMDPARLPRIRDRIVAVLNNKSFSELESIQGKLFLKDRITDEVNKSLDKGVVKDVFFSEFVVQ